MKKSISIFGSTGSIGLTTLQIIDIERKNFTINILCANKNYKKISYQIKKHKPKIFIISNFKIYEKIKKKFSRSKVKILNSLNEVNFKKKTDLTIAAIPGISGLPFTLKMIEKSKKILIANKESIICGWDIINKKLSKYHTNVIPIDSEHYSIFKLLENHRFKDIEKIYITASGGPFLNYSKNKIKNINPEIALKHPKWKMGKKISIDSATLMNKILEFVEAQKLFNISKDKLDILIHPESLVHAIIKFKNGLSKFIYHETSMIIPIANAIFGKKLIIKKFLKKKKQKKLDIRNLTFQKPNEKVFPIIKLKKRANEYPSTSIIINASNEVLVDHFLKKKVPFYSISKISMNILNSENYKKYAIKKPTTLNQIIDIDNWARKKTMELIRKNYG